MTTEYQFTKDWFHWAPEVWQQLIPLVPANPKVMEIGSFEGRSTVWIAENMLGDAGELVCIDTWEGGEEHGAEDMGTVEARFDHNRKTAMEAKGWNTEYQYGGQSIAKVKGTSYDVLASFAVDGDKDFDFIYIDGSHIAKDVLTDACMAWQLLKPKGLMVFDDYMWGNPRDILHRPKPAIDAFCNLFAEEAEIVHVGYQLVVRKKG
jgi:predicted O-methyltransferase YrrM